MKIIIKKLQGKEFELDVEPTNKIIDIKRNIAMKNKFSISTIKLLHLGRTLADDQTIEAYPGIKDGTKINLVVKKPEGLLEGSTRIFKEKGMSDAVAKSTAQRLVQLVQEKFNKMSWDDIEKLAWDCLMFETGQSRAPIEHEMDCEDAFGL